MKFKFFDSRNTVVPIDQPIVNKMLGLGVNYLILLFCYVQL